MEKAWPPLSECVQFKIGLMDEALRKYPWEDDNYAFDFNSCYPPIPEELASLRKLLDALKKNKFHHTSPEDIRNCPFCRLHPDPRGFDFPTGDGAWYYDTIPLGVDILNDPVWDMNPIPCPFHLLEHVWPKIGRGAPRLVTPTQLEDTKKYLNQVRNSRGYDVDCVPHLVTPEFWNSEMSRSRKEIMKRELDATAIVHINNKTNKVYQLEDILKIVYTRIRVYLVTFTAKVKNDDSAALETFIATTSPNNVLKECLLKPSCDAPGPDHYPDFIIHPIQVPDFSMKRRLAPLGSRKRPGEHYPTLSKRPHTMTPTQKASCPMVVLTPKASEEHPRRFFSFKQHPSSSTAEEMLTIASDDQTKRFKSKVGKSQAGVTLHVDLSPLDPSPAVEENQDKGGGSTVHVEENPEAQP